MWEAFDKGVALQAGQPDRHRRREPASASAGPTELGLGHRCLPRRAEAFGARTFVVDGHDLAAIDQAPGPGGRPERGSSRLSSLGPHHQRARASRVNTRRLARQAVPAGHGRTGRDRARRRAPPAGPGPAAGRDRVAGGPPASAPWSTCRLRAGRQVATRKAYGEAWPRWARVPMWWRWTARSATLLSRPVRPAYPGRYFEMYIASSSLVAAAVGMGVRGYRRSPRRRGVPHPGLRLQSGWRHLPGQHLPVG